MVAAAREEAVKVAIQVDAVEVVAPVVVAKKAKLAAGVESTVMEGPEEVVAKLSRQLEANGLTRLEAEMEVVEAAVVKGITRCSAQWMSTRMKVQRRRPQRHP